MKRFLVFFAAMLAVLACSGCASVLTHMGPLKSELEDGETTTGDKTHYSYSARAEDDVIYLEKTPVCAEMREKIRKMKKQPRGILLMILEIPVYGLGVADFAFTHAVIESSKKEEKLAEYETGNYSECGETKPAPGETMVIRNYAAEVDEKAVTDQEGRVDLDSVLPDDLSGYIALRISVEDAEEPFSLRHTYNADSR